MKDSTNVTIQNHVGILTVDSPPVNALGIDVRIGLDRAFRELSSDAGVHAIILICGGRTFFSGADIREFDKPIEEPSFNAVFDLIERSSKPVIAAIHGTALGAGLELALICHYRAAVPSAKFGLPEVNLGLLPGGGGTQRLPRIVGPTVALDLITSGRPIGATEALRLGLIDMVADEGRLLPKALEFARQILERKCPLSLVRDRQDMVEPARSTPEIFEDFRKKNARTFRGFKAPEYIISAIKASVELPFNAGIAREAALFQELLASAESAAQRYSFLAEREATKIPGLASSAPTLAVKTVGIIGAGTMGGGIAMSFLNAGIPVTVIEANQTALDHGISVIRANYETSARRGKLTDESVKERLELLTSSLEYGALQDADLIVEAVFESLQVKQDVFRKIDKIAKPSAILASNTSFLDLEKIASVTNRPESVIGLHFFSPANVMRLLEIVRGAATSNEVLATAIKLAKQIGKLAVVARVCDGFIANRLMRVRGEQADAMILEGTKIEDIDRAMYEYGFAVGPFQMMDIVGLDVAGHDSDEKTVMSELVAKDRLGQKKNGGYYDYDGTRAVAPSPVAIAVIAEIAREKGIGQNPTFDLDDIIARLLYPVVNEGARILEEGIAIRASDIDVAAIAGYNWPVYTGGPMFWADTVGLRKIVTKLNELEACYGSVFKVSPLLEKFAAEGRQLAQG
jgi:3-hydroxyacyl-CoA dehydrogenase